MTLICVTACYVEAELNLLHAVADDYDLTTMENAAYVS